MGEVYLAEDTRLDRKVALKLLPAQFTQDPDRVHRFIQEAKAASALNHPNIITIYEIGQEPRAHYIAAEYIDGQTLRAYPEREKPTLLAVLEVAVQVASALVAAHEAGIVHRDIKPENVMLRRDGIIKVLDFGLAKLTEKQVSDVDTEAPTIARVKTDQGTVMGTARYMSPEQARGQKVDARTDIFSLGVMLYEMIAGKPPFGGVNALEVIGEILKTEPQPLKSHVAEIPPELQRIVGKTLRKNRDERYQTARDLLNDLKEFKEELSYASRQAGPAEEHQAVTAPAAAAPTAGFPAATTSSATIILGEIKRHKLGFGLAAGLLLVAAAAGSYLLSTSGHGTEAISSIAVLPFQNVSGDADAEYLSDGMTETLIGSLSHIPKLNVKARSSVFRYKGKNADAQTIGRELDVQAILLGRVAQRAEQLILNLELVDTHSENVIWSEQYNRKHTDLVSLQTEIARDVSDKLRQKLTAADEERLEKRHTDNTEAYQLYLQGRFQWNKRTKESLTLAVDYFHQAIAKDPDYALAYSGLADCYTVFNTYELATPGEAYTKARIAAQKALEIDPTLGEAYATLADVKESFDWDFEGAERDHQKAIALAPNYATAHQWYGELLRKLGRSDEAIAELQRARELDPLSLVINASLGQTLFYAGRYDEAILQLRKVLEINATFASAHGMLGRCYTMKEMYGEAIAEHQKAIALSNGGYFELGGLAITLAKSGKRNEARKIREQLTDRQKHEYVDRATLASLHFVLGDKEEALSNLEKAYEDKSTGLAYIKVNPAYDDEFRSHPRFRELLRKVGLPLTIPK